MGRAQTVMFSAGLILLQAVLSPVNAANLRSRSASVSTVDSSAQSVTNSSTAPFGSDCKTDAECVSVNCVNGKCGYSGNCRTRGQTCQTYAAHTCCTGNCEAVTVVDDCRRLLEFSGSPAGTGGISLARACQHLGVCESFPGTIAGPSRLSKPWAVPADDMARKYFQRAKLTFAEGVSVKADMYIAHRTGQTYQSVEPDTLKPGSIRDAGVVEFTEDSTVKTDWGAGFAHMDTVYCAAPIMRNGAGGGYFAIGVNCCDQKGNFQCDDSRQENVKSGLVVTSGSDKFMQAVNTVLQMHGHELHGKGKGIETNVPIMVRMLKDYASERKSPTAGYSYATSVPTTHCVAPVLSIDKPNFQDVEFWAVGEDCCSLKEGFHCGEVDIAGARSGEQIRDTTGQYNIAVSMAEIRYGMHAPDRPFFVKWSSKILVPAPGAS